MVKTRFLVLVLMAGSVLLASCGGNAPPTPVLGPDGQPTGQVVQQQQSPGLLGMFGASMAGSMVGNMLSGNRGGSVTHVAPAPSHTVINKTIINHPPVVAPPKPTTSPQYRPPAPSVRSYSSSSSRSYSGGGSRGRR